MPTKRASHLVGRAVLACFLAATTATVSAADPVTVDRIVAVVDREPILLSDVQQRAAAVASRFAGAPLYPAGRRRLTQKTLEVMIEETPIRHEAKNVGIEVTTDEIDRALHAVAEQNGISVERTYEEAAKAGMDRAAYREELRRSLQEQKLLHQDVAPKISIDDTAVQAAYDRMVADMRRNRPYRPAWIVVRIPRGASEAEVAARKARAEEVVRKARDGASFADLAQQYSDDTVTKVRGGDLGERVPAGSMQGMALRPELEEEALRLEVGQTSDPIRVESSFAVLHILDRPAVRVPSFEDSMESLRQRVYTEKLSQARAAWLEELRSHAFVDLRFTPSREADDTGEKR